MVQSSSVISRGLLTAAVGTFLLVGGAALTGCKDDKGSSPAPANSGGGGGGGSPSASSAGEKAYPNTPEGLKQLVQDIHAAQRSGDTKTAARLTRGIFWPPDEARARKALRDDAPAAVVEKILAQGKQPVPPEEALAKAMAPNDPKRTEIQVHAATTEQLKAYEKGTPAFAEFPGGAKKAAETVLRPGVTFYEVEALEPGNDAGTKWHLFFWDGGQWTMLGPVWRFVE